jgi:hypothetical protein
MQVYPEIEERVPSWVDRSKLKDQERPLPVISFTFNQVHQGVPIMDRACSVQVDALTGKIIAFYNGISGPPVPLPDNRNVVPVETARSRIFKTASPETGLHLARILRPESPISLPSLYPGSRFRLLCGCLYRDITLDREATDTRARAIKRLADELFED